MQGPKLGPQLRARGGDDDCFLGSLGSVGTSDLVPCKMLLKISVCNSFPSGYFLCCSVTTEQSLLLEKDGDTDNQFHKDRHRYRDRQIWTHTTETEHTVNMKQRIQIGTCSCLHDSKGKCFYFYP